MGLISVEKMAEELGSTKDAVYCRLKRGQLPPPLRIGDTVYWRDEDWRAWLILQALEQGALVDVEAVVNGQNVEGCRPRTRRGRPRKTS